VRGKGGNKSGMHVRGVRGTGNSETIEVIHTPLMAPASFTCRYCRKPGVSQTLQGLRSHISQTPRCRARQDEEFSRLHHNRSVQAGHQHTPQQSTENSTQQENLEESNAPSNNTDEHHSKRARVDDNDDDKNFQSTKTNFIVDYPAEACAGAVLEDSQDGLETRFEKTQCLQQRAGLPAWVPFNSLADWELSQWLIQSGVSQREIVKFLKLESVHTSIHNGNL